LKSCFSHGVREYGVLRFLHERLSIFDTIFYESLDSGIIDSVLFLFQPK
jgi:hypothetical protein